MKEKKQKIDLRVKNKAIGGLEFTITYVIMLFFVGVQVGLIVFPGFLELNKILQIVIIMSYWALIAIIFGVVTNYQMKKAYDKPLRKLSLAAKKVAEGDFSVYVEPNHTADKYDYIDVMFLDFNTMVQELGSIETLKNDFVSNVSHEIKTPLAVIRNYITILKKGDLSKDLQEEYMDTIIKATNNLSALVSNILRLNKLENQEIGILMEEFNLCRQLSDCILSYETLIDEKNIELVVDIEDKTIIMADENILKIVWNNLLSNAIKFTKANGKIFIYQYSDKNITTIRISDTGKGMDKKTMKHIFDKFYQGETSHSGEGNGLGLALSQRIVEKLNGTLTVSSEINKGSVFTVILPINYEYV